jgi:hypothetical protein
MSRLMRKVNADESCDNYESLEGFRAALPWDEDRVTYIAERWDVSRNCARSLILSELGKNLKEIASLLYVTKGTAAKYQDELMEKIHVDVVMPIQYKRQRNIKFDVWGDLDDARATESPDEIDNKFLDTDPSFNKGSSLEEIDNEHITINT